MWFFQSTESSRFFVYCEVSINLFLLSYTLTVLTGHNNNISDWPFRCSQVSFCCCCLSQVQVDWRFPTQKIPCSASAKVTWVERFSSATRAIQGYYGELQASVLVCCTCTPHLTNTFSPAQWLNPKQLFQRNKGAPNSAKPQCRNVPGKGGATVCSAASVSCRARSGANTRWDM